MSHQATKVIPLGSTTFRQWRADSHCKYIHGYRLLSKIWFACDKLDENNWVFDFGNCKELKELLEHQFDHTLIAALDDPKLQDLQQLEVKGMIQLRIMKEGVGIEKTAQWVFNAANNYAKEKTNGRARVKKVEVWEHEGNSAIYE